MGDVIAPVQSARPVWWPAICILHTCIRISRNKDLWEQCKVLPSSMDSSFYQIFLPLLNIILAMRSFGSDGLLELPFHLRQWSSLLKCPLHFPRYSSSYDESKNSSHLIIDLTSHWNISKIFCHNNWGQFCVLSVVRNSSNYHLWFESLIIITEATLPAHVIHHRNNAISISHAPLPEWCQFVFFNYFHSELHYITC